MALLWQKKEAGTHYEVRRAGNSVRLYSNGVFHSQWNERHVISDSLWDLLAVPGFFLVPGQMERALILGVGGGAVVMQLRALFGPKQISCIELDPVHLDVAKNWFGVQGSTLELHHADACRWLGDYRGPAFDYIVDDLFGHRDGVAERAVPVNREWADCLCRHLSERGALVVNFATQQEFTSSVANLSLALDSSSPVTAGQDSSLFGFSHPRYHNRIAALVRCSTIQSGSALKAVMKNRIHNSELLTLSQKRTAAGFRCRLIHKQAEFD